MWCIKGKQHFKSERRYSGETNMINGIILSDYNSQRPHLPSCSPRTGRLTPIQTAVHSSIPSLANARLPSACSNSYNIHIWQFPCCATSVSVKVKSSMWLLDRAYVNGIDFLKQQGCSASNQTKEYPNQPCSFYVAHGKHSGSPVICQSGPQSPPWGAGECFYFCSSRRNRYRVVKHLAPGSHWTEVEIGLRKPGSLSLISMLSPPGELVPF